MPSDDIGSPPDNVVRLVQPPPSPPPEEPRSPGDDANASAEGGGGKKRGEKVIDWGRYGWLLDTFALIYSTDTVWDAHNRLIMKIAASGGR